MCLRRFKHWMSMTQNAAPFVPMEQADWNRDDAVARHETAHALVWFHHGGGIGPLRAIRESNGLLLASVKTGPRPNQSGTPDFIDAAAERLLAGEVASRIYLGLDGGRIALRKFSGDTLPKKLTAKELAEAVTENPIGADGKQMLEDITKVLLMANDYHPERWKDWIAERLAAAESLVRWNWAHVDAVATSFSGRLPRHPGATVVLASGADLIRAFDQRSVPLRGERPVELL